MNELKQCPQCGSEMPSDGPANVCPKCFLQLGLSPGTADRVAETTTSRGAFVPPKPEQLAPYFPQLEILDLIGQGGMGAVYKARQRGLDRLVALKILPPHHGRDPAFAQRFERECRALARLNHPSIVAVHDSGLAGGLYYFVMEYVEGINLRQAMQTGELTPKQALAIVRQICDALQFAHEEGIVHRDIKPENILLDKKARVKIADFGLARLLNPSETDMTLTGTHQVMGTPRYMAPEQLERSREVDHRADIYSLGVVFYEMLTGELPLGRFSLPSQKVHLDVRLDEIVLRTLEKEPTRRYQHASDLKGDVETVSGLAHLPAHLQGRDYRSAAEIFGIPLVHIASGTDPTTGRKRVARGIIAIGDVAVGVLAIGGVGFGGLALGGVAIGLLSFGGVSLGMLAALGGLAVGLGFSIGGCAVGSVAVGGFACGIYAFGGGAFGMFALGGNARDPEALRFFGGWATGLVHNISQIGWFIWPAVAVFWIAFGLFSAFLPRRKAPEKPKYDSAIGHRQPQGWHRGCCLAGAILLIISPCLAGAVLFPSYLWLRADRGGPVEAGHPGHPAAVDETGDELSEPQAEKPISLD